MQIGKYQLLRKLATGGMAEVFLAKATGPMGFEKTLVVKRILPHLAEDPAFTAMFLSEAKLAAQLNHPNVVQIFDFGEADGSYYLAMEYIDGPNLRVLSKRASKLGLELAPTLCARIIANACEGLAFAHDFSDPETGQPLGLVHRDISPDNLLLSRQGSVKVVDFGIAKASGQSHRTQTGVVKGKIAYMPPEQLRNQPLDQRTDVYALGIVLYELLTGHRPFDANEDADIMRAILFEPLVPAVERQPGLPRALLRIVDRALAKHREQRYPGCRGFQADLEQFILDTGTPVGAYQLAQFVLQVTANTEALVKTPPPGTSSRGSMVAPAAPEARPGPPGATPPTPAQPPAVSVRDSQGETQAVPSSLTAPAAPAVSRRGRAAAAIGGVALLLTGGGLLYALTGSAPAGPVLAPPALPSPAPVTAPVVPPSLADSSKTEPKPPPPVEPENNPVTKAAAPPPSPEPAPTLLATPPTPAAEMQPKSQAGHRTGERRSLILKPPRKPSPSPPVEVGKGTIQFRIVPYATVILDGKELGQTPLPQAFEVPAGKHTVTLVNKELGKEVTRAFQVGANEERIFKLNLLEE
jgi:serine/threonine-protein kinase